MVYLELMIKQRKWNWIGHTLPRPSRDIAKACRFKTSKEHQAAIVVDETRMQGMERSYGTAAELCELATFCVCPMLHRGVKNR